jgi:hypothetical protein
MGLFNSLFGPSWSERVNEYMLNERLPIEERIRLCILKLHPIASGSEIAQGLPCTEIQKHLSKFSNSDELKNLAAAIFMRKGMRKPIILSKSTTDKQWSMTVITIPKNLPANDELRYRRLENGDTIIWNPIY